MAKKHWPFVVGLSLLTGLAGSSLFRKRDERLNQQEIEQLLHNYVGSWWFIEEVKHVQHRLKIDEKLNLHLDGRLLQGSLQELTKNKLVFQDQYGYHLAIHCLQNSPVELYDEADDKTYQLLPIEPL